MDGGVQFVTFQLQSKTYRDSLAVSTASRNFPVVVATFTYVTQSRTNGYIEASFIPEY